MPELHALLEFYDVSEKDTLNIALLLREFCIDTKVHKSEEAMMNRSGRIEAIVSDQDSLQQLYDFLNMRPGKDYDVIKTYSLEQGKEVSVIW